MPRGAAFAVAPIAATFLALLQRPVKIAQIRDDAFAPEWEWKGVAGRGEGGGGMQGRREADGRASLAVCPFNLLDCAPCRRSTDLGLELGSWPG